MQKLRRSKSIPDIYKIVYFGAVGSGKRTNLKQLERLLPAAPACVPVGNAISLELPASPVCSKPVAVHTIGTDCLSPLWMTVLRDVHGVVFVADSDEARREDNVQAMSELIGKLSTFRIKIEAFPFIIQYNKRDLSGALGIPLLEEELNPLGLPAFNVRAQDGSGVVECLNAVSFLVEKNQKV